MFIKMQISLSVTLRVASATLCLGKSHAQGRIASTQSFVAVIGERPNAQQKTAPKPPTKIPPESLSNGCET